MQLSFYQKLALLFLVFFTGIAVIGFLAFRNNVAFMKSTGWVEHTQKVLNESEEIFSLTQKITNNERGYVITHDSGFLNTFTDTREKIFLQIGTLKALTADNAVQQSRVDSINFYVVKRIDIADKTISNASLINIKSSELIAGTKLGRELNQKIRNTITNLQSEEDHLLIERKKAGERRMEIINRFLYGLFGGLLVLLTLSYLGFIYNHKRHARLEHDVRNANHFLNTILENIPNMIFVKGADDLRFVRFNRAGEKLLGMMRDNLIGKNDFDFFPGEQAEAFVAKDREVLIKGEVVDIPEEPIKTAEGEKWLHTKKIAITDETGKAQYLLGISEDITESRLRITEIKQLNEELAKTVNQLIAANKEMEAFTYSVSHDLRAPLRIIDGFGEILLKDYGSNLDEDGKHTIGVIMSNAKHMGQLIDDLLNLSRLGRTQLAVKRIDMHELVEDVIRALKVMDSQVERTEIEIMALPTVECDLSLVRQVWVNLISNAIKYSRKNERPHIDIGSELKDGKTVYYIKDNGVGFDMKYYNKLFGVFQRLHKVSEFEGTGVGLALVHRIVTKHGGQIWAEAIENKGAAFYFTLT